MNQHDDIIITDHCLLGGTHPGEHEVVALGAAAHPVLLDLGELGDLVKRLLTSGNEGTTNCLTLKING